MNIRSWILCMGLGVLTLFGCKKSDIKSLADMKKEQTRAINNLTSSKSLRIVESELPSNPDPQIYYKLENGLYMRVLSSGDTRPANMDRTQPRILIEAKGYTFSETQSQINTFDNLNIPSVQPIEFRYVNEYGQYGASHFYPISQTATAPSLDNLMCEGLAYPMSVLGNGAKVSLIIPFELGPTQLYTSGQTIFVEEAVYTFVNSK